MLEIAAIDAEEMRTATAGAEILPLEQSEPWEQFSESSGNPCWGRVKWTENGKTLAVAAFYEYEVRGFKFLWSRRGPVWIKSVSPEREEEALTLLQRYVKEKSRKIVFVRLHAWFSNAMLREPFRVIGYDRTVIIDGAKGDRDKAKAALPNNGRRLINRAQKRLGAAGGVVQEETGLNKKQFEEFYQMLVLTAERDGFTPHELDHYWSMLDQLGPEHARLFSVRVDGELACWVLVGVYGRNAVMFYGASSQLSRATQAAPLLDFEVTCMLAEEGVKGMDMMGIHSPRTPSLFDVGRYKMQFASAYTDVPGLWDMPIREGAYRSMVAAMMARNTIRQVSDFVVRKRKDA